jgi:hypothetical protein
VRRRANERGGRLTTLLPEAVDALKDLMRNGNDVGDCGRLRWSSTAASDATLMLRAQAEAEMLVPGRSQFLDEDLEGDRPEADTTGHGAAENDGDED